MDASWFHLTLHKICRISPRTMQRKWTSSLWMHKHGGMFHASTSWSWSSEAEVSYHQIAISDFAKPIFRRCAALPCTCKEVEGRRTSNQDRNSRNISIIRRIYWFWILLHWRWSQRIDELYGQKCVFLLCIIALSDFMWIQIRVSCLAWAAYWMMISDVSEKCWRR